MGIVIFWKIFARISLVWKPIQYSSEIVATVVNAKVDFGSIGQK
jgi:hypothetical protein